MIAKDIRIEGFDARTWTNLVSLFAPNVAYRTHKAPRASDAPEIHAGVLTERTRTGEDQPVTEPRGTLFLVVTPRGRVLSARHSVRGRVKGLTYEGHGSLESLAREHGARRVLVLREGAVEEVTERATARLERHDDYGAQLLTVMRTIRDAMDTGAIHVWPRPFAGVPIPTAPLISRAMDGVLPDDHAMVLGVFSRGTLWTFAALRRSAGEIDRVIGPDVVLRWTGPLGGDFRRDHRVIADAVTTNLAPVHLGIFAEVEDLTALLRSNEPGAWARAIVSRDIIVHPTPPYVAVALAADGVRAAAKRTESWLAGTGALEALSQLAPIASYVRGRVGEVASVTSLLGFDPLKLLAAWLERADDDVAGAKAPHADARASDDEGDAPREDAPPRTGEDE
jgi:hypothetical protein